MLVRGDVFADVDDAVARAYDEVRLRKSVVRDAVLDRANTGDNTPAFCDIHPVDEPGAARLHLMLKGGGSDNASRVVMLVPGAGKQAGSRGRAYALRAREGRERLPAACGGRGHRWHVRQGGGPREAGAHAPGGASRRPTRACARSRRSCSRP